MYNFNLFQLLFHGCFFSLTMNEIVRPKKTPNAASSYTVHRTRLQVNKHSPGNIFTTCTQDEYKENRI